MNQKPEQILGDTAEVRFESYSLVNQFYKLRLKQHSRLHKLEILWQHDYQRLLKSLKSLSFDLGTEWTPATVESKWSELNELENQDLLSFEEKRLKLILDILPYREDRLELKQELTDIKSQLKDVETKLESKRISLEDFANCPNGVYWRLTQIENRLAEILRIISDPQQPEVNKFYAKECQQLYDEYSDLIHQLGPAKAS